MHELSLCKNILAIINQHAIESKGVRVKKICLEIGQLTGVDRSALLFSFEVVSKGTLAEFAVLEMIEVEGLAVCDCCQTVMKIQRYYDPCQHCGCFSLTVTQGEELRVKSMEME